MEGDVARLRFALVAPQGDLPGKNRLGSLLLDVFRHVNHHRSRPAAARNVKSFFDHARNFVDIGDQVAVFHNREGHPEKIGFLKAPFADHMLRDLAGDRH